MTPSPCDTNWAYVVHFLLLSNLHLTYTVLLKAQLACTMLSILCVLSFNTECATSTCTFVYPLSSAYTWPGITRTPLNLLTYLVRLPQVKHLIQTEGSAEWSPWKSPFFCVVIVPNGSWINSNIMLVSLFISTRITIPTNFKSCLHFNLQITIHELPWAFASSVLQSLWTQ